MTSLLETVPALFSTWIEFSNTILYCTIEEYTALCYSTLQYSRLRNKASGPEIVDRRRPLRHTMGFCGRRMPCRPPKSMISGPKSLLCKLKYTIGACNIVPFCGHNGPTSHSRPGATNPSSRLAWKSTNSYGFRRDLGPRGAGGRGENHLGND